MKKLKNTIRILLFCIVPLSGFAQFDEQFYQPTKEWRPNSLPPYEEMWITAGADSVHAVWCKPLDREARAVVVFCHGNSGNISCTDVMIAPLIEAGSRYWRGTTPASAFRTANRPTRA